MEELEGKIVKWGPWTCKVVGCEYDLGITIVDNKDTDHYLICVHGRLSKLCECEYEDRDYKKWFDNFVRWINEGEIPYRLFHTSLSSHSEPSAERCPFSQ